MAKIWIDGRTYEVESANRNLLEVCLTLRLDLPYFCWHPALGSVGACRQCAVKKFKNEEDAGGKIVVSCMEPVPDGLRISINDPEAKVFRANVIEWLMANHPHDCAVCDEGGECHLQDMTVMTQHNYRRYRFKKRTYNNQYLGPFINHEMNRCIQCYRCVRFYRDYAGGGDLNAFASRNQVYFGRAEDGVLENEFSGNLIEICPTGVFTDKTLKQHYTRKWDLQSAPSVCVHCGLGCNIIAGERYGSLRRILSRYNGSVNGYFICDRGRFGYDFVNSAQRINHPWRRGKANGQLEPVDKKTILTHTGKLLAKNEKVIGIGSPRASLESNFALRELVGEERFYQGVSEQEQLLIERILDILQNGPARTPTLKEVENADAVLVLGEDLINTAPMLALALRQSVRRQPLQAAKDLQIPLWHDAAVREVVQDKNGPFFVAAPCNTKLDEIAAGIYHATPDEIARLGFAIAHRLDPAAPQVKNLTREQKDLAEKIAAALRTAKKPLVVSGTACRNISIIDAAANVARALHNTGIVADLCYTVPESNSLGLALMGGGTLPQAMEAVKQGKAETVIILENDLYRRAETERVERFLEHCKQVIVIDHFKSPTAAKADVLLPAATFAGGSGTLVNNEGRAQRFYRVFVPPGDIRESWRWLNELMLFDRKLKNGESINLDSLIAALTKSLPVFKGIEKLTPPSGFKVSGTKIPRQPHRYSGRTAMLANVNVSEPKPPEDVDSPLGFSMEGYHGEPPSSVVPFFWSPAWNSVQSINKYQIEVGGHLHDGDPGRRLIEPPGNGKQPFFTNIPKPFTPGEDEWLIVPVYHIFGSEEMSGHSPAIAERAPGPYLGLNKEDALNLRLTEGDEAEVELAGKNLRLPVKVQPGLPGKVAAFPAALVWLPYFELPAPGKIRRHLK